MTDGKITETAVVQPEPLETREDVVSWFHALLDAGISFHPEDTFTEVGHTGDNDEWVAAFSDEDAARMDRAMEKAYAIVGDACEVAIEVIEDRKQERLKLLAEFVLEHGDLLREALDSHLYWQVNDDHSRRNDGFIMEPYTEDEQEVVDVEDKLHKLLIGARVPLHPATTSIKED